MLERTSWWTGFAPGEAVNFIVWRVKNNSKGMDVMLGTS